MMFGAVKRMNYLGKCANFVGVATGSDASRSANYVSDFKKLFLLYMDRSVEPEMAILFVSDKILAFFLDGTVDDYRESSSCSNAPALAFMMCKRFCEAVLQDNPKMVNKDMLERVQRMETMMHGVEQGLRDYEARKNR